MWISWVLRGCPPALAKRIISAIYSSHTGPEHLTHVRSGARLSQLAVHVYIRHKTGVASMVFVVLEIVLCFCARVICSCCSPWWKAAVFRYAGRNQMGEQTRKNRVCGREDEETLKWNRSTMLPAGKFNFWQYWCALTAATIWGLLPLSK